MKFSTTWLCKRRHQLSHQHRLFLGQSIIKSLLFSDNVPEIIATPATEPAPHVATVITVAATTVAATATTATAFFTQLGQVPASSVKVIGLLMQYVNRLYCVKFS